MERTELQGVELQGVELQGAELQGAELQGAELQGAELQGTQVSSSPTASQSWLASRLIHRQVVNAPTLEPLGRVTDVLIDPKQCRLAALSVWATPEESGLGATVRRVLRRRRARLSVTLEHIISVSGDVVIVDLDHARQSSLRPTERAFRLTDVCGLTIITLHGLCLGSLSDVLLDPRGGSIAGYVIHPTKQAEQLFVSFEEPEPPDDPHHAVAEADAPDEARSDKTYSDDEPPAVHLRVIPASPRVHFGDSLIMVVEDIEPLVAEPLAISDESAAQLTDLF